MSEQCCTNAIGTIWRNKLKFNPDHPEEDLFFIDGATTRIEGLTYRKEGKLMFGIPQLAPGSYALEIRKGYKANNEIRKGTLSELLVYNKG